MKTHTILTERFLEFSTFIEEGFYWADGVVTLSDIANGIEQGIKEQPERFRPYTNESKDWHIGRIIYFINDPSAIRLSRRKSFAT